ncbi:hypothetical protein F5B20DRAFT_382666 [Whalleya microplaca]|nr:hypothetical protein F5B20DRAFT_382666 [Whalleya microplaca]
MSVKDHVEVKQSEIDGAGRGLFARQDFSPGALVASVDRPLVAELEINHMLDTCGWCFQRAAVDPLEREQAASMGLPSAFIEVKSCTGCRRVGYCSKTCQSKGWKREHKHECKVLVDRPDLPVHVRAVVKLLGRLKAASAGSEKQQLLEILQFRPAVREEDLDCIRKQNKQKFDEHNTLAQAAWNYAGKPVFDGANSQTVSTGLLFNLIHNTVELSSALDNVRVGSGFDPLICSANHSCEPNAVLIFNQPSVALRALRPIKKGEEILLAYTDVTCPFAIRQANLTEEFSFTCQCPKCKRGLDIPEIPEEAFAKRPEDLPAAYHTFADRLIQESQTALPKFLLGRDGANVHVKRLVALEMAAFAVSQTDEPMDHEVRDALQRCINSGMWSWTRQPVPQLCHHLFRIYLTGGEIYKAFRLGCKIFFEIDPALHPQTFYPDRLVFAWVLSTLTNVLAGPVYEELYKELAQSGLELRVIYFGFLFYVYDNIPKMHGWESPLGKVVDNTYKQIMAGVGLSRTEIEGKVERFWPNLEIYARSVDVIKLCESSDDDHLS